ncbi:MAG: hypothetical protein ABEN55_13960 [Bradymonadaceae bacterium]
MASPSTRQKLVQLTVDYLVELLVDRDLLSAEQADRVRRQESSVRTKILKQQVARQGRQRAERYQVSPGEVVAHFQFTSPDGRLLDEDRIMQTVADDADVPYHRPDPLDIDMDLIAGKAIVCWHDQE